MNIIFYKCFGCHNIITENSEMIYDVHGQEIHRDCGGNLLEIGTDEAVSIINSNLKNLIKE